LILADHLFLVILRLLEGLEIHFVPRDQSVQLVLMVQQVQEIHWFLGSLLSPEYQLVQDSRLCPCPLYSLVSLLPQLVPVSRLSQVDPQVLEVLGNLKILACLQDQQVLYLP